MLDKNQKYLQIFKEDLNRTNEFISELIKINDNNKFYLQGLICYKKNKFKEAAKIYKEESKFGNLECMYKYAQIVFIDEGTR